jgi:hypothetical protein
MKFRWLCIVLLTGSIIVSCQSTPPELLHEGTLKSVSAKFGCDQVVFEDGFTTFVRFRQYYQIGGRYRVYRERGTWHQGHMWMEDSK